MEGCPRRTCTGTGGIMRKPEFLLLVSASFLANGMYPIVATTFGVIFVLWAFWEARRS